MQACQREKYFKVKICVTAQHREMLDQVLELFRIKPDIDLNLMQDNQTLEQVTCDVVARFQGVLAGSRPDYVFVQGDTTTAFAVALASFYHKIPVCHVEAGLRTGEPYSPFPEEMNRQLISRLATYHFAPTAAAKKNLLQEGVRADCVAVTGNTVIDALFDVLRTKLYTDSSIAALQKALHHSENDGIKRILVTAHRRENFGGNLENLCSALKKLAQSRADIQIVYPVHPNPNVAATVKKNLAGNERIVLLEPLDYGTFVWLMNTAYMLITDSGGVQEEAPSLGKPVLVFREATERPEGVAAGTVKLVGTSTQTIYNEAEKLLSNSSYYEQMTRASNPYGDGKACERIVQFMKTVAGC